VIGVGVATVVLVVVVVTLTMAVGMALQGNAIRLASSCAFIDAELAGLS
jgi:hypothetical protein